MIYTVTFNPAIDYVVNSVDELKSGAVNRVFGEQVYYGGKGINVSVVLKNLGIESVAMGFLAGFTGRQLEQHIDSLGIKSDFIHLQSGITRINLKIIGENQTEFNADGPDISEKDVQLLMKKLDKLKSGDILILAGNIPSGLSTETYGNMLKRLAGKHIKVAVDANGKLLMGAIKHSPFLIKPNLEELSDISGKKLERERDIIEAANKLRAMGAENVLVSIGVLGAILVSRDGKVEAVKAPQGKVENTIGCGDSTVAGFIAGYIKTKSTSEALKYAVAAGCATAFSKGLASGDDIESLRLKM